MNLGGHSLQTAAGPWRAGVHAAVASLCSVSWEGLKLRHPSSGCQLLCAQRCLRPGILWGRRFLESSLVAPGFAWVWPCGRSGSVCVPGSVGWGEQRASLGRAPLEVWDAALGDLRAPQRLRTSACVHGLTCSQRFVFEQKQN